MNHNACWVCNRSGFSRFWTTPMTEFRSLRQEAQILYASPSAQEIYGPSPETLEGRSALSFVHDKPSTTACRLFDEAKQPPNTARKSYLSMPAITPIECISNCPIRLSGTSGFGHR